ncbi:hypothetical protein PLAN_MP10016 (plasmid) [Planktothrix rubescens CCAP 1459/22]|uniref:Uncharacterized protein n=1 Tax=Planktothrix rubescens CCAP 1459/22 TaxID=329571 RepID=A0A6J7ZE52_PLARU|nr:hypothetical protein PLAN_MP10016 [Planktothrix rubescens NIVA-CYA 18]
MDFKISEAFLDIKSRKYTQKNIEKYIKIRKIYNLYTNLYKP